MQRAHSGRQREAASLAMGRCMSKCEETRSGRGLCLSASSHKELEVVAVQREAEHLRTNTVTENGWMEA